jgi:hypothetical protein
MTIDIVQESSNPRKLDYTMKARSILKNLRIWLKVKGWEILLKDKRRHSRLRWLADHACLANPKNQKAAVRRECLKVAPDLSDDEVDDLIAYTKASNKRWTPDQSAAVWDIGFLHRERHRLWHFGAFDDINYERRIDLNLEKEAARKRNARAARSSSRPRGRPRLNMTADERREHDKALATKRQQKRRASRLNPSAANRKITPDGINRDATPSLAPRPLHHHSPDTGRSQPGASSVPARARRHRRHDR